MNSSIKFPENDEIANHKMKALELNANQFQAQFKPLFNENTKLKQHVIGLNFFIEERKLQLSNLINDTGPNGEDRVLVKAVADFKQICDLLEEEILRLNNTIVVNTNDNSKLQIVIKQLKEKLQCETDRFFQEKQSLIDQNRRLNEYHKQQSIHWEQNVNRMKMKIEDICSRNLQLDQKISNIHKHYKYQLEERSLIQNQLLMQLNLEKQEQLEKFEDERRSYLQQLEMFSNKLNENKAILINEYEYKIQSQKMKLENQIQKLTDDCSDYRTKFLNIIEKNKILQYQVERQVPQFEALEKEIQDQKYKVFLCDENLKTKEAILQQKQILIDQLNDQIKKLKQDKGLYGIREQSKKQGQNLHQNKTQSPDKIHQQTKQSQIQRQGTKQREPIKQPSNPDSQIHSSAQRKYQSKQDFTFEDTTIEQYVENNKQEMMQSMQQSKEQSRSSSVDETQNSPIPFIKIVNNQMQRTNNTDQFQQHLTGNNQSLSVTQGAWCLYNEVGIQCDLNQIIDSTVISNYEIQIAKLNDDFLRQKDEYEFHLKCKDDEIIGIQEQVKLQKIVFESNQEKKLKDIQRQQQEDLIQKDNAIKKLEQILIEKDAKIQMQLDSENIYQAMIDQLNNKLKQVGYGQNDLILKFQDDIKQMEVEHQIEQKRLLDVNEKLKQTHKQEIENLNNQHQLDQEQLIQEKTRLQEQQVEHEHYIRSTNDLLEQAKSKEFLLDNYRRELLKTNEIVKYLSLEIENYKKINNIFRSKNEHSSNNFLFNGMGFLPTEVQDKIKQKMNKAKQKKQPSNILKDVYAMNFQLQKGSKMKSAKLVAMNANSLDQKQQKLDIKFKLETLNELNESLPKINSKNVQECDRSASDRKHKIVHKNLRSKTQQEDYTDSDPKRILQDINSREILLIQSSQMLLSQIKFQPCEKKNSSLIKKNNHSTSNI
ncbi:unnamed protein product (macronuclear) [Paramecium tetraurelia]|uniref:Uncharacterized protein n=1 Tax=Paramecium tetraurelia TaxID=5888 RepID=A0CU79_PARTE|nr:uncharacterized protein GSPATT00010545001 [Paramecium tetraurelia]CAK74346.1 unnamed protein product [Paramecium tetraurelia]|eukprot:XP_001441743.1 hypothetical protein (macronuclear) [Paramecium tetraurelia strain d4-2]